jgi:hypothetical protein
MLATIYRTSGIHGWYRGMVTATLGSYPGHAIHYISFEMIRNRLHNMSLKHEMSFNPFLIGMIFCGNRCRVRLDVCTY